ncbi:cytochrome P450 [Aspergillus sergii]|uniref:Cytochrome P450 n=1 Tax=Aspergillus sergii TaxID=1034303 RepID=A0A5N6XKY7_9EURO|nr:cytochrome P450 [Aspergillus sergii]
MPLIGILNASRKHTLLQHLEELFRIYTNTFLITILGKQLLLTCEPENIRHILSHRNFGIGLRHAQLYPLFGDSVFSLEGQKWSKLRRILYKHVNDPRVLNVDNLDPHVEQLFTNILQDGDICNVQRHFHDFTIETFSGIFFGPSPSSTARQNDQGHFTKAMKTCHYSLFWRMLAHSLYWTIKPSSLRNAAAYVHNFVAKRISESIATKEYSPVLAISQDIPDSALLHDQIIGILAASHDTTSSLLSSTLYFLARNQRAFYCLRQEILDNLGPGKPMTFQRLKDLPYLQATLNETLRLFPPVPFNLRVALQSTSLPTGGNGKLPIYIKQGQIVVTSAWHLHRDKDIWGQDADDFIPERWLNMKQKQEQWAFVPFGAGPRTCLGRQYALSQAGYVIARLLQVFDHIEKVETSQAQCQTPRAAIGLTISHADGVYVRLSKDTNV